MKTSIFYYYFKEKLLINLFLAGNRKKSGNNKKLCFCSHSISTVHTHTGAITQCRMSPIVVRGDKKKTKQKHPDQLALPLKQEGNIKCTISRALLISHKKTRKTKYHPLMDVGSF